MNIGIIGLGIVGGAVKYGFQKIGHTVKVHDIKLKTKIEDVLNTEICYICVPTPSTEEGLCDVSAVMNTIDELIKIQYLGIIAIKSTLEPGTTAKLQKKYKTNKICFVPEFLRERVAISDFAENQDLCVIGTNDEDIFNIIKKSHGTLVKKFIQLSPTEAELTKYFTNIYNAILITFANTFYDVCKALDVDYINVKSAAIYKDYIHDRYLDCNENFRGFGGICLPKDLRAIIALGKKLGIDVDFFEDVQKQNKKYKRTITDDMRDELIH